MEWDWIETVGYVGTAFTIVAYGVKNIIPLRVAGILSSFAFLSYGLLTQSYPIALMEAILLPVNAFRLAELLADARRRELLVRVEAKNAPANASPAA